MSRQWLIATIAFVLIVGGSAPAAAQSRSAFWESWDVEIVDVDTATNSFVVREIYRVRFSGTFRFGVAELSDDNLQSISNVQVYQDGQVLRASCSETAGTYCVRNVAEGVSVTYFFNAPITDGTGNFIIEYTVNGALRSYEGGDQLWWTAVPQEKFGFAVQESTITVALPDGYGPREGVDPVVTYGVPSEIRVNGPIVVATATERIDPNERFEIRIQYPHDPRMAPPGWQSDFDQQRDFEENLKPLLDLAFIALGLLIGIGGPLGVYGLWYSRGRDPQVGPVPEYLSELPADLPPALVGALVDERADTRDVLSTIIDLAQRGYVVIQEDRKEALFGMTSSEFTFKRTDKPADDLRRFERDILQRVFNGRLERELDDLKNKFYAYLPGLKDDLYAELVNEGLFSAKPATTRAFYSGIGSVILFLAAIIGFLGFGGLESGTLTETLLCLPMAIGVTGVAMMLVGNYMPRKTRKGAEEAAKWNAFRKYLSDLERYEKAEFAVDKFDRFLPFAVAFGVDRSWIRRFSQFENTPAPVWYYPTYRGGYYSRGYRAGTSLSQSLPSAADVRPGEIARAGGGGFNLDTMAGDMSRGLEGMASGLSNMLESASRTITSAPKSASSGSSGSWRSGGSSWSGGGSSGGGSSGGGGRGFG
ncbi:MAG: DUF2207 family protein [Chloroflexota bacterium]